MFLRKLGKDHQIISRKDGQSTLSINHQADILHRFNRNSLPYLIYILFVIHECFSVLLISSCQCILRVRHVKILSHVINQSAKFFDFAGTTVLEFTWKFQIQLIRSVFLSENPKLASKTDPKFNDVGNILSAEGLSIKWGWLIKFLFRVINSGTFYTFWLWSIMMDPNWRILPKSYHFSSSFQASAWQSSKSDFFGAIKLSNFNGLK